MKLYFEDSHKKERFVADVNSPEECSKAIKKFLKKYPNFKSYYTRVNFYDDKVQYDVGSWTEFFNLRGTTEEELKKVKKEWYGMED